MELLAALLAPRTDAAELASYRLAVRAINAFPARLLKESGDARDLLIEHPRAKDAREIFGNSRTAHV